MGSQKANGIIVSQDQHQPKVHSQHLFVLQLTQHLFQPVMVGQMMEVLTKLQYLPCVLYRSAQVTVMQILIAFQT